MRALLNAYDKAQAGMSEEEKEAMNQRVVSGEESFSISADEVEKERATTARLAELEGTSMKKAEKDKNTLEEAAKTLNAPGIDALLKVLGADETKKK
jgi:hypothetical protein